MRNGGHVTDTYLKAFQDRYVAAELAAVSHDEVLRAETDPAFAEELERRDGWIVPSYRVGEDGRPLNPERDEQRHRLFMIEEIKRLVRAEVEHQAQLFGATPGTREYERIERNFVEAQLRIVAGKRELRPGVLFGTSYQPLDSRMAAVKPEYTWTVRKLADHYLEVHRPGASWQHKVDVAVTLFEQHLGRPTPIGEITRDQVRGFIDLLLQCPERASLRFPGLTLREAVEANKNRKPAPFPTIHPNTIRDNHYAVLRRLFSHAVVDLQAVPSDPTQGIKIRGTKKKTGNATIFEITELNRLFELPVFTGCESALRIRKAGEHRVYDHRFWTPLIMLFSGARPSEIAQLAVSDVKLMGPHPWISVLTEFDPEDPQDRPYVLAFKTDNARRNIPLHPTLIDLGFPHYVERMQRAGSERLFPEWKRSKDDRKLYSGASWVRQFNEKDIPSVTQRYPRPTIYSLRHTFKTQMVISRVAPQYQNQVMGHAGAGMDPHYLARLPVSELYEEVAKVKYDGLKLDRLTLQKYDVLDADI